MSARPPDVGRPQAGDEGRSSTRAGAVDSRWHAPPAAPVPAPRPRCLARDGARSVEVVRVGRLDGRLCGGGAARAAQGHLPHGASIARGTLYAHRCALPSDALELDVPVTSSYQAQSDEGAGMNAGLYFVPGEAHIVLRGTHRVLATLREAELAALVGHELARTIAFSRGRGRLAPHRGRSDPQSRSPLTPAPPPSHRASRAPSAPLTRRIYADRVIAPRLVATTRAHRRVSGEGEHRAHRSGPRRVPASSRGDLCKGERLRRGVDASRDVRSRTCDRAVARARRSGRA